LDRISVIAASVAILLGLGFWWPEAPWQSAPITLRGPDHGHLDYQLPDGTAVILNAQAALTYTKPAWLQTWDRTVQLEGEAFFDVVKTPDRDTFQVLTTKFTVAVLGTRFNVRNLSDVQDVVLQEGRVHLTRLADSLPQDTLTLFPGERALIQPETAEIVRKAVTVEAYTSWQEGLIILDGLALRDIVRRLETAYGWNMVFEDTALVSQTMQGRLPTDDPELVKVIFTRLLNLHWEQHGDTIILTPHP
jgi:ferric-dicitrate binding protein FerR (iron transport regulator)